KYSMRLSGSKASNLRQQRQLLAAATVVIGLICIGFIWLALAGGLSQTITSRNLSLPAYW
uniref:hypothetical protein n=1 Tax=Candidatus Fimenecus sp. TaxID=3022888 RepID=UPI003FEE318F